MIFPAINLHDLPGFCRKKTPSGNFWGEDLLRPKMSPEQEFGTTNQVENGFNCWLCLNHFIKIGIWLQLTCRTQPLRSRAGNIPRNPKTTQKASKKHTCVTCQQITFWHCVSPQTARSWWLTSLRRSKKIKKQDKVLNHCSTCSARAWVFWNHYPRPKSPKAQKPWHPRPVSNRKRLKHGRTCIKKRWESESLRVTQA